MSGHSKWSKVKHQKASSDVAKGQAFTKASRAITVAVRTYGSSDPSANFRLRLAIEQAKAVNMPKDTIERVIRKAEGVGEDAVYEVLYEAYGPHGVALLIEAATNNTRRTVSEIKSVLSKYGGRLTDPGAVSYLFERVGCIVCEIDASKQDDAFQIAVDAGAEDIVEEGSTLRVYTKPDRFFHVRSALQEVGSAIRESQLIMRPKTTVVLPQLELQSVEALIEALNRLEDVLAVSANTVVAKTSS